MKPPPGSEWEDDDTDEDFEIEPEDLDPNTVYTNDDTGEKCTYDELTNKPEFKGYLESLPTCDEPGHNCHDIYMQYEKIWGGDNGLIPDEKMPIRIMNRKAWGAAPPKEPPEPSSHPALKMVFHYHTEVGACVFEKECKRKVKELQRIHMEEKGLNDIAYNFVVGGDNNIYVGRGWFAQPDNSLLYPPWRHRRIDIGFMAPVFVDYEGPTNDVVFMVYDFIKMAILKSYVHANNDLYLIFDKEKALSTSNVHTYE